MKDTAIRFFGQYYLYAVLLVVVLYFLVVLGLPVLLFMVGIFSLASVLVAKLLKRIIAKKRNTKTQVISTKNTYAFPSSHAAGLSSLLISTFGNVLWIFIAISTSIILFARVKGGAHDGKDIIGGLLVGALVTGLLTFLLVLLLTL